MQRVPHGRHSRVWWLGHSRPSRAQLGYARTEQTKHETHTRLKSVESSKSAAYKLLHKLHRQFDSAGDTSRHCVPRTMIDHDLGYRLADDNH